MKRWAASRDGWLEGRRNHRTLSAEGSDRYQQRVLKRNRKYYLYPLFGLTLLCLLLVWEVVRQNVSPADQLRFPWRVTFLGVSTTASLAAGLAALILARNQFAHTVAPNLGYPIRIQAGRLFISGEVTMWLYNVGPGIARVESVEYLLVERTVGVDVGPGQAWLPIGEVRARLKSLNLEEGVDYMLHELSAGAPLPPVADHEDSGFEMISVRRPFLSLLSRFEVRVRVQDGIGDLHERILDFTGHIPPHFNSAPGLPVGPAGKWSQLKETGLSRLGSKLPVGFSDPPWVRSRKSTTGAGRWRTRSARPPGRR
jgi:hypothetical protein